MKILLAALNSKFVHTNLAVRYIKSYCSEFDIDIKEFTINDNIDNIIGEIAVEKPDLIGFSCYIWNISMVLKACSSIKKILPDTAILLGGPEVSYDSQEIMNRYGFIDYIIKGEGEEAARQLFSFLDGGKCSINEVGNLIYRHDGRVLENKENELIRELDAIPFPYGDLDELKNKIVYFESSRGCPYNCSYCLSSTIKGVRFFSKDRVLRDLNWFMERDIELVKFVDRTFNCGKAYKDIIKFIIEKHSNTRFHFEISGSILDEEAVELLCNAPQGLFQIEAGVQTTNEHALKLISRAPDFDLLSKNILKIREKGNVHIHLDLIAGLPGETYVSFSKSFNDVYRLKPHMLQLGFLKLLKGSSIRADAETLGIKYADYPPYEVLKTRELSFEEICSLKDVESEVDRYYNSGRFEASLSYLNLLYQDPFKMFKKLSEFMHSGSIKYKNIGNAEQYKIILDFCSSLNNPDKNIVKECLLYDYLKQGRNPYTPEFLKNGREVAKQRVWDFFSEGRNLEMYLPHYTGINIRDIVKNIVVVKFSFDILRLIEKGEVAMEKCFICIDYGLRSKGEKYIFRLNKFNNTFPKSD